MSVYSTVKIKHTSLVNLIRLSTQFHLSLYQPEMKWREITTVWWTNMCPLLKIYLFVLKYIWFLECYLYKIGARHILYNHDIQYYFLSIQDISYTVGRSILCSGIKFCFMNFILWMKSRWDIYELIYQCHISLTTPRQNKPYQTFSNSIYNSMTYVYINIPISSFSDIAKDKQAYKYQYHINQYTNVVFLRCRQTKQCMMWNKKVSNIQ